MKYVLPKRGIGSAAFNNGFTIAKGIMAAGSSWDNGGTPLDIQMFRTTGSTIPETFTLQSVADTLFYPGVILLLTGDGPNGSTSFTDASINNRSVTPAWNTVTSTARFKFGGSSIFFDGDRDHLTVPDGAEWAFGASDFCFDFWYNPSDGAAANRSLFGKALSGGTSPFTIMQNQGHFQALLFDGSTTFSSSSTAGPVIVSNTWYHVALSKAGTTARLFVNGALIDTFTAGALASNSAPFTVGAYSADFANNDPLGSSQCAFGYIDDFRVTKGFARYTVPFDVPSFPAYQASLASSSVVQVQNYSDPDGTIVSASATIPAALGSRVTSYSGWIKPGIFMIEASTDPSLNTAMGLTWSNLFGQGVSGGANQASAEAVTTFKKQYTLNSSTYELTTSVFARLPLADPIGFTQLDITRLALPYILSNNNLTVSVPSNVSATNYCARVNRPISTGKWYWEIQCTAVTGTANDCGIGVTEGTVNSIWSRFVGGTANSVGYFQRGAWYNNSVVQNPSSLYSTFASGDRVMVAFDADARRIWFGKNGVWQQGDPSTNTSPTFTLPTASTWYPALTGGAISNSLTLVPTGFAYTVPTGFSDLATLSVPLQTLDSEMSVTVVPYRATDNTVGSTPFTATLTTPALDQRGFQISASSLIGCTMYIQWGKASIDALQSWIINDLVENTDFVSPPATRLPNVGTTVTGLTIFAIPSASAVYTNNPVLPRPLNVWGSYYPVGTNNDTFTQPASTNVPTLRWLNNQTVAATNYSGYISGYVLDEGAPVPSALVRLYRREGGMNVDAGRTDLNGFFSFNLLDPTISTYFVVAFDPEGGVQYNAKVFDRLTPTTTPPVVRDPIFASNSLLLHSSLVDVSQVAAVPVSTGVPAVVTDNRALNGAAIRFSGADALSFPSNTRYEPGSGDLTVELWVIPVTLTASTFIRLASGTVDSYSLGITAAGLPTAGVPAVGGGTFTITYPYPLSVDRRHHLALVKSGTTYVLYVNGVSSVAYTGLNPVISNSDLIVGAASTTTGFSNSLINEVRITKGKKRYVSNFVPLNSAFPGA